MHPADQAVPLEHREVTAHRLRRDIEVGRDFGDVDPTVPACLFEDLLLPFFRVHEALIPP